MIVGYQTKTVEANKFYMIAVQFQKSGTTTKGKVKLNDLISMKGIEAVCYDEMFANGAQIQVPLPDGGYKFFYYINDALNKDGSEYVGDVWADGVGEVAPEEEIQALGAGFWFKAPVISENASITVKGEILSDISKAVSFTKDNFQIIANPFPSAISLKDIKTSGLTAVGYDDMFALGAQIQVMQPDGGYKFFYYINDALNKDGSDYVGNVWADGVGEVTEGNDVPAGQSFWIKAFTDGTLEFTR